MGNRGVLHDEQQRIRRQFNGRRWLYCVLQFKSRRQVVIGLRRHTQLFFLDEATALAAGHRPCAERQARAATASSRRRGPRPIPTSLAIRRPRWIGSTPCCTRNASARRRKK